MFVRSSFSIRLIRRPLVAALLVVACAGGARADEVLRWNRVATDAGAQTDPLTESRVLAIMHLAVHDALNAIDPRFERYSRRPLSAPRASPEAAAATAAATVLSALVPKHVETFNARLAEALRAIPDGPARIEGIRVGRRSAQRLLARRTHDGAANGFVVGPGTKPGEYRPTPPENIPAALPHWGRVTPFALPRSDVFRAPAPPALDSAAYAADFAEVAAIGSAASRTRTPEQTEIAKYWYEDTTKGWNRITREVVAARGLDAWESARLFALVNVAIADGFIAGFETKYHYDLWRPVTAIRDAAADGNPETQPDAAWLSALPTPPVPDYVSTHTVTGSAAARVLARVLGTDYVAFRMTSGAPYAGITRGFASFSEAAFENGQSRVLAGVHFGFAVRAGYQQGEAVGSHVADTLLRPLEGKGERATN
jgi:hypothetical protein